MRLSFEPGHKGRRDFGAKIIVVASCSCLWVLVGINAAFMTPIWLSQRKKISGKSGAVAVFLT
jgi:hypothetical protein